MIVSEKAIMTNGGVILSVTIIESKILDAPFTRDIRKQFEDWYQIKDINVKHLILFVKGPRQCGKTSEILKFTQSQYKNVYYIDLAQKLEVVLSILNSSDGEDCVNTIERICYALGLSSYEDSEDSVLVLDEIQISVEIYNSLRTFRGSLNCHIIITGSYLGIIKNADYFQPTGDTFAVEMTTLSFSEFCIALDRAEDTSSYNLYKQIGGYPNVVKTYKKRGDIDLCHTVIGNILGNFINESSNYFSGDKDLRIFNTALISTFNLLV